MDTHVIKVEIITGAWKHDGKYVPKTIHRFHFSDERVVENIGLNFSTPWWGGHSADQRYMCIYHDGTFGILNREGIMESQEFNEPALTAKWDE